MVTPNRVWLTLFACWILILSGFMATTMGTPGILQTVRLKQMLDAKNEEIHKTEIEITQLDLEKTKLQTNHYAQETEIRRVLGYAAEGEIVFDFTRSK